MKVLKGVDTSTSGHFMTDPAGDLASTPGLVYRCGIPTPVETSHCRVFSKKGLHAGHPAVQGGQHLPGIGRGLHAYLSATAHIYVQQQGSTLRTFFPECGHDASSVQQLKT